MESPGDEWFQYGICDSSNDGINGGQKFDVVAGHDWSDYPWIEAAEDFVHVTECDDNHSKTSDRCSRYLVGRHGGESVVQEVRVCFVWSA